MSRSVGKSGLRILCLGAFLCAFGAARAAQACDNTNPSWANRDDDGDGFCNGVDLCAYDFDTVNNGASCKMQAITVPWVPSSPSVPHSTYTGASVTLKGIARYGGTWFKWDYGDGSTAMAWTAIGNAYDLSVSHVYTGSVGRIFAATLSVGSGGTIASPTTVSTATYLVQIQDTALSTATLNMAPADTDVLVNMAIDRSLWYLHQTMGRSQYGDGATGYNQTYGSWAAGNLASTCAALDAFQLHGSNMLVARGQDPYQEDSQRALAFVFVQAQQVTLSTKSIPTGSVNPAFNLSPADNIGIRIGGDDTYGSGICGVAIGSGGTPGIIAKTGPADVYNTSYANIMQRVVDWFAQYQHSPNDSARGGWWYSVNSNGADGSTNQWPILAMTAARSMGVQEPAFVKQETPYFIAYSEHTAADSNNGGWGYTTSSAGNYLNTSKAAAGMLEHYFVGDSTSQLDVKRGMGFIYRHWTDNGDNTSACWNATQGHIYAMYGIMKAMRVPSPQISRLTEFDYNAGAQTSNSFDWYYTPIGQSQRGLATAFIQNQYADGHWADQSGCALGSDYHSTAWGALILTKGVTNIPPSACIDTCGTSFDKGVPVNFTGNCSSDSSPTQSIVKYEWDFNYNGSTFNPTSVSGYPSYQATTVDNAGYSFYTQDHNGAPLSGVTAPVVALRVTDSTPPSSGGPLTTIAKCNVNIKPPPHCPVITAGGPYTPQVGQTFTVNASGSTDVDADPLTYAWDFQNNGLYTDATGATATVSFSTPGTHVINVKGTDHPELNATPYNPCTGGCSAPYIAPYGDCSVTATVVFQVGAQTPTASAGGPYTSVPNNTVTLDASASSDPDVPALPLTYAWDLTGKGVYTDSTAMRPTYNIPSGAAVGSSTQVCVKVNNGLNTSKPACTTVTVIAQQVAPVCSIISTRVVAVCSAGPQKIQVDGSNSYDINGDVVTYKWTTNCPATIDNTTSAIPFLSFNTAQEGCSEACAATLTVNNGYFTSSCVANIDIVDTNPPVITTTPGNLTVECDANATTKVTNWVNTSFAATDSCAVAGTSVALTNNFQPTSGCGGVGVGNTTKVTWTGTDVCYSATANLAQVSANVSVVDTTAPVLTLPSNITKEATAAATPVTFVTSALDYVSGSTAVTCTPASGTTFVVGTTTVNCTSKDAANNTASGSFTVTITDTTAPTLALPSNITKEATGPTGATASFTATATDLASGVTAVTCTPASGSVFPIGVNTVSCQSTDTHTNTATGTFTVTVQDTTAPVVTVPSNITKEATSASGATASFTTSATDIVSGSTAVTCAPASGATFALGVTTVNCQSTDSHSNTGTASFTVTVKDTTAPVLTLSANLTQEATGPSGAAVSFAASASDLVSGSTAVTCTPASGATFALGTTTVNCNTKDAANNASSGSFTVTVRDTTAPALTLPANITQEATSATGAVVSYVATANDLVSGVTAVTCTPASATKFAIGVTTVTCNSTDTHANTATGSFTVTVRDTTAPVLALPSNITSEATGPGGAPVSYTATASDLVSGATAVTCSAASGSLFSLGVTVVNCQSTDSHSNTATGSFTVSIVDTTPPAVTVPSNLSSEATGPSGAVVTFNTSALDIVDGVTSVGCTPASGSTFPISTTTVTCTSTDVHANTGTATFTVTVTDTTAPIISGVAAGSTVTVEATMASGTTLSTYGLSAIDIVDGATTVVCTPALPFTFPLGTTAVGCTSTDQHNNTSSLSFSVAIVDTTPPAMTCPANVTVSANGPLGAESWGVNEPTSTALAAFFAQASEVDLVDPLPTLANNAPSLFAAGVTTVTFTGTDAHQNSATCSATVTVVPEGLSAPTLICPSTIALSSAPGARLDWSAAFRRPVAVELLLLDGATPAARNPLTLSELDTRSALLTGTATAPQSYAARIRATDQANGVAMECNVFVSVPAGSGPAVAAALRP
jgi:hypothetical protein